MLDRARLPAPLLPPKAPSPARLCHSYLPRVSERLLRI